MSNRSFRGVRVIHFSDFEFDIRSAELRRSGVRIRLQEQPFRILTALLERPGEVVTREEVRKRLWPNDTAVEVSHGINAAVQRLREALGETAGNPQYIETLPRRGYRFVAPLRFTMTSQPEPASQTEPAAQTQALSQTEPENLEGNAISHFRIREKLGTGGMGVVYRADDLKLGRQVALKLLPRELAADPAALNRFRREAQAASSLNHPNICTIYGVEECDGQPLIVMELLEGETLEAILARGALPVEQAVSMAILMASALDAAHRKGIVHRDFKPANVLVGKFGLKVLDFGLAKMDRPVVLSFEAPAYATQKGAILGTLHYMSPEQVQGKDANASSDIFSFGVVLYEMLTGRRAFDEPNTARVMAAILTLDPPPLSRPIPPPLALVLRRCLAKEPEERWQTARDLKAALELIAGSQETPSLTPQSPLPDKPSLPFRLPWRIVAGIACLCLLSLGAFRYFNSISPHLPKAPLEPRQAAIPAAFPPFPLAEAANAKDIESLQPKSHSPPFVATSGVALQNLMAERLSLSPDGQRLAYIQAGRLYVRRLGSGEVQSPGQANGVPFWSPDSRSVAAVFGKWLMRFDLDGSPPRRVCAVNTVLAGAWGPDGTILIGLVKDGIYRVPASGGSLAPVTTLDLSRNETRHLAPRFLPGGRRFLYIRASAQPGQSMLYAGSLESEGRKEIMPVESNVEFVARNRNRQQGYLVFTVRHVLAAKTFNLTTLTAGPVSIPLEHAVASSPALDASVSTADFSVTGNLLAFRTMDRQNGITVARDWTNHLSQQPASPLSQSAGQTGMPQPVRR